MASICRSRREPGAEEGEQRESAGFLARRSVLPPWNDPSLDQIQNLGGASAQERDRDHADRDGVA